MRTIRYLAVAAAVLLPVQPCLAADDFRDFAVVERRSAAFAGVRLRLPLGAANPERPSARLQLTSFHDYRDAGGAMVRSHRAPGIELGLNPSGRISYHIGGTDVAVTRERLRASGGTTTWIIVGGLVVAVVILAAVVSAQPTAGPPEGAFD
jgi:hypothetical protein